MPRLKLKPLKKYPFCIEIAVRTTDLNYGGHLGNDSLLSLLHEARVAYLAFYGFTELDCGGVSLIMADAAIVYLGEAFAGDILIFEVSAGELSRCGFRLFYHVIRQNDGKEIALAESGMVCYDYKQGRIKKFPEKIKKLFSNLDNS